MNYKEKIITLLDNKELSQEQKVKLEEIFPELKESEDERIRKWIIDDIRYNINNEPSNNSEYRKKGEKAIAWLEKQDYTFEIKEGHWYKCVCDYMLNNSDLMFKNDRLYYCRSDWRLRGEIDERNVKYIGVNGYKSFFRPATNQEIKDWLENQGESDETKAKMFLMNKGYPIDANGTFPTYEEIYNIIRDGLEEQGKQILANSAKTCKDEPKEDNRIVTERIKTFEDACNALGDEHPLVTQYRLTAAAYKGDPMTQDLIAYLKLRIIVAALNEGWEPKFEKDEYRYYPWFYLYTKEQYDMFNDEQKGRCVFRSGRYPFSYFGFVLCYTNSDASLSNTCRGSRLAFRTRELAAYAGRQFIGEWADFLLPTE